MFILSVHALELQLTPRFQLELNPPSIKKTPHDVFATHPLLNLNLSTTPLTLPTPLNPFENDPIAEHQP